MTGDKPAVVGNSPGDSPTMTLEFCGEWFNIEQQDVFIVGREGPLGLEDNPYLHRKFLVISHYDNLWWIENSGSRLSATISDGNVQAWLSPGARLPLVFARTSVMFTAGPTTYEFFLQGLSAPFTSASATPALQEGDPTIGNVTLTESQKLLILSLAEPVLRGRGSTAEIPTSAQAAARLGWALTRFNRKLDNVCDKLSRDGVKGLRGGVANLAVNRRGRLVEYAIASGLVQTSDLDLLDQPQASA